MPDYTHGTPSWIDLNVPDPDAAVAFYGELFGWTATEPGPVEETGGYRMFQQGDAYVGGLMGHQQEGQPTVWATYVTVDDADATAAAVEAGGGTTHVPVMDVGDAGRMAFFTDPAGAGFGIWQAKDFGGADLVNEPVSLCWNELMTRDAEGAQPYYGDLFGWAPGAGPGGDDDPYVVWQLGDRPVAGMMAMGDETPAEVPPNWGVCFAVADTDAVFAKARELGATEIHPPTDIPIGRFAVMTDPQGAAFSVIQFPDQA